jgi:phosphoribosylanthranilate isomerase
MPDSPARAVELAEQVDPDIVQLHGDFAPDALRQVRGQASAEVVLAVDATDPDRARECAGAVDALLVDSTTESGAGGTGETHDWTATRALACDLSTPVVLAGGLTPDNVAEAVRTVGPYAVDVASGVECEGGRKDADAVERFVRSARAEVSG